MSTSTIKAGDIVQVRDLSRFVSVFSNRVKDRDAVVEWVGPDAHGQFKGQCWVIFQKRNGRGKEFRERMHVSDLVMKEPA